MGALSGLHIAELTVKTIRKCDQMKKLSYFSKPSQRKFLIIFSSISKARKRKRPNYGSLNNYFQVEGYSNSAKKYHPTTPEQYFRQQYFEKLDLIISSIKGRFNQPVFTAFLKIKQPLLNIILHSNYEDELHMCLMYTKKIQIQCKFIVCIGVSTPLLFLVKLPLKSSNCPSCPPSFQAIPPIYCFFIKTWIQNLNFNT